MSIVSVKIQSDNILLSCKYSIILTLRLVAMLLCAFLPPPIQKLWIRP